MICFVRPPLCEGVKYVCICKLKLKIGKLLSVIVRVTMEYDSILFYQHYLTACEIFMD